MPRPAELATPEAANDVVTFAGAAAHIESLDPDGTLPTAFRRRFLGVQRRRRHQRQGEKRDRDRCYSLA